MKIAITGTNFVSDMFMDAAKSVKHLEVTAVCSGHRENADRFAAKYNIPLVFDSLSDMLKSSEVEAVYLGVPNHLHEQLALECIHAHKHVFVEKPFTPSLESAKRVFAAAMEEGVYVHDGIVPLYSKSFEVLKGALSMVGPIRRAIFSFSKYSSRYDAYLAGQNPTTFRRAFCNGCWMDLGVYCLADCVGLFGRPLGMEAHSTLLETGVDATAAGILHYDGFDAVILASKVSDTKVLSEIEGENGTVQLDGVSRLENITFFDRKSKKTVVLRSSEYAAFSEQIEDFVENVEAGHVMSARVPHELSLDVIQTVEECRKASGVFYPGEEEC